MSDVVNFFMSLLTIHVSSFKKYLFKPFVHFHEAVGLFVTCTYCWAVEVLCAPATQKSLCVLLAGVFSVAHPFICLTVLLKVPVYFLIYTKIHLCISFFEL